MESSPTGVLFCVEPWNFPYYQLARVAVPQCAIAFEKLLLDAGAPVGAYTNLRISYEQSDLVIDDPRVKGVALTGSLVAGRRVAARGKRMASRVDTGMMFGNKKLVRTGHMAAPV